MQERKEIAVAGGTGRAGGQAVEILRGQGHGVVSISRSTGLDSLLPGRQAKLTGPYARGVLDSTFGSASTEESRHLAAASS